MSRGGVDEIKDRVDTGQMKENGGNQITPQVPALVTQGWWWHFN